MGQIGVLAWFQSLVLMGPWLLMFGLLSLGITLNLASVLLMVVLSVSLYIILGRRLRSLANQDSQQVRPPNTPDRSSTESATAPNPDNPTTDSKAPESQPLEVPPTTIAPPPISADDLKAIQGIFGIDTFFATETIPYQDG